VASCSDRTQYAGSLPFGYLAAEARTLFPQCTLSILATWKYLGD